MAPDSPQHELQQSPQHSSQLFLLLRSHLSPRQRLLRDLFCV